MGKRKYGKYNKFDVVYADFGRNPHGIQGGIRPGVIISCGFGISKTSDFMTEDAQTISKSCIRAKSGTVIENSGMREEIDRALIKQFDLLPVARKMVMEELANGQQN